MNFNAIDCSNMTQITSKSFTKFLIVIFSLVKSFDITANKIKVKKISTVDKLGWKYVFEKKAN